MLIDMGFVKFFLSVVVILRVKLLFLMLEFISDFLSCKMLEFGFK